MKIFWKLHDVAIEEMYKAKMVKSYNQDLILLKFFYYIAVIGQAQYFYNINMNIDNNFLEFLPMKLRFSYYLLVFRFFAMVLQFWAAFFVLAFETVLVYSCLNLNAQFQMVSQRLKIIINEEDYKKCDLVVCIKHHNFLLRFAFIFILSFLKRSNRFFLF